MTSVFLSYARADDEPFVRRLYDDLTAAGFTVWFDRQDLRSRGLTFHHEIRDAIDRCDRLVLIIGPKAVTSEYVRQEWQYAWFDAEKVITPILRLNGETADGQVIDGYKIIPEELKLLHCEDFRDDAQYQDHIQKLVKSLNSPPPLLGQLLGDHPALPNYYLTRTELITALREAVRAGLDSTAPIGGTATHQDMSGIISRKRMECVAGMGGIGKSFLACLLARDRFVREAFSDGIVWVRLGSLPDLAELIRRVLEVLGGDGTFQTKDEGKAQLQQLLADKAVLLILDDAWDKRDVEAFNVLGAKCRALITTRDAQLLTSLAGTPHLVDLLTDDEALRLLAAILEIEIGQLPRDEATKLLKECGRLPLAVSLAAGMIAAGMPWVALLKRFSQHRLEFFEDEQRDNQHHDLFRAIEVSVQTLEPAQQLRLAELGVFPEGETVPEAAIATLWQHTGNLDLLDTQKLLVKLKQRSLLQLTVGTECGPSGLGRASLHALIRHYCLRRAETELGSTSALHVRLLDAYHTLCPKGWWTGPNDGYFFTHLRTHLVAAGRASDLADLLHDLRWLETKNEANLTFDIPHDFFDAMTTLAQDDIRRTRIRLLHQALMRDIEFIHRHRDDYPQALFQCFWNNCWWYDAPTAGQHYTSDIAPGALSNARLYELLEDWRSIKEQAGPFVWLASLRPPPIHLDSPLVVTFPRDDFSQTRLCFSPDGSKLLTVSGDKAFLRDAQRGTTLAALGGHAEEINGVAFAADGHRLASSSKDSVRIWDAETGAELLALTDPKYVAHAVRFRHDGSLFATGLWEGQWGVWDVQRPGVPIMLLEKDVNLHRVEYSPDGRWIGGASYNRNGTRLWNVDDGRQLTITKSDVWYMAFSTDGRQLATRSISWDDQDTVRIWDVATGSQIQALHGDILSGVMSMAFSRDGVHLVTGGFDGTVRIWDIHTGAQLRAIDTYDNCVNSLDVSPKGYVAIGLNTVWLWDPTKEPCELRESKDVITSLSISADSKQLATGSTGGTVRLWNTQTGLEAISLIGHTDKINSVAFAANSGRVASASDDNTVRIVDPWAPGKAQVVINHSKPVRRITFSPDGSKLASTSDEFIRIWESDSGIQLSVLRRRFEPFRESSLPLTGLRPPMPTSLAFSSDGLRIVCGSPARKGPTIYNDNSQAEASFSFVHACNHEDSSHLTACRQGVYDDPWETAYIFETKAGHELGSLTRPTWGLTPESPDGRLLTDGHAVFNKSNMTVICHLRPTEGNVRAVVFSPDSRWLATGSDDTTVRVWDLQTGVLQAVLAGHTAPVVGVTFLSHICCRNMDRCVGSINVEAYMYPPDDFELLSDELQLASLSEDNSVRLWDVRRGQCLDLIQESYSSDTICARRSPYRQSPVHDKGQGTVAWFPFALWPTVSKSSGRLWAGAHGRHLHLLRLEGDRDPMAE